MDTIPKFILRRINLLDEKFDELFSEQFKQMIKIYSDYSEESFHNLIVMLLRTYIEDPIIKSFNSDNNLFHFIINDYETLTKFISDRYKLKIIEHHKILNHNDQN